MKQVLITPVDGALTSIFLQSTADVRRFQKNNNILSTLASKAENITYFDITSQGEKTLVSLLHSSKAGQDLDQNYSYEQNFLDTSKTHLNEENPWLFFQYIHLQVFNN